MFVLPFMMLVCLTVGVAGVDCIGVAVADIGDVGDAVVSVDVGVCAIIFVVFCYAGGNVTDVAGAGGVGIL